MGGEGECVCIFVHVDESETMSERVCQIREHVCQIREHVCQVCGHASEDKAERAPKEIMELQCMLQ